MKRLATVFALTTLAAASLAMAQQQYSPSTSSAPPPGSSSSATSQDQSTGTSDKQALMKKCLAEVQAANPTAAAKDIQAYCDREVKAYSTQSAPKN
jgi:hypothetical protein